MVRPRYFHLGLVGFPAGLRVPVDRVRRLPPEETLVVAGIATNFGVESTVRSAWELSYDVVVIEDACTSRSAELHDFAIRHILPQIARVVASDSIALA